METLASVYLSTTYEESANPQPVADHLKLNWKKLPSSAWIRLGAIAISLAILSISSSALAIQRGNHGSQVSALQRDLASAGFYNGPVTGFYGELTQTSVSRFQQARGLRVDGIAGSSTLSALRGTSGGGTVYTGGVLQRGSRGAAVTQLQNRLRAAGFFNGPITGYYGQLTQTAVSRFQQARGLRVDGVAGTSTLAALGGISGGGSSPPSSTTALRRGSRGAAVTQLQRQMRAVGVYSGPITGYYGGLTQTAVRSFQRSRGLTVNGIADARTLSALQGQAPGNGNTTTVTLQSGSSGAAVTRLQTRLRDLGFYRGGVTGSYGPLTETAVRDFQRSRGLTVNGIAGPTTLSALQIAPSSGSRAITSLQRGNRGPRVRSLQNRLIGLGYYRGPKDGVFGPGTEAALRRYQQDRGLVANGIADARTFASLAPRA